MTDTTITPEAPAAPVEAVTPEVPASEPEALTPSREAAKYRTQLRAAEGQRDALTGTVETLQRQIIEGIIADKVKVSPAGVFAVNKVADFLDADGNVDPQQVFDVASATAGTIGLAQAGRTPAPDPSAGNHQTGDTATWSSFMQKR